MWQECIKLISRNRLTLILACALATVAVILWPPERVSSPLLAPLHQLEWLGYDALFALRGPAPSRVDPRIVVVGFDESTETLLHAWPPPRHMQAQIVDNLKADGATLIVFDVLFSGASTSADDKALDAALSRAGNVVLSERFERDIAQKRVSMETPYYDDASGIDFERKAHSGFAEIPLDPTIDSDRTVRRMSPVMSFQDEWQPSLAGAAYLALTGNSDNPIRVERSAVRLGDLAIPRTGPTAPDPIYPRLPIPSAYMDFPGGLSTFPSTPLVQYDQVYRGEFAPGTFRGKIVFIGVTGTDLAKRLNELFTTAFSHLSPDTSGAQYTRTLPGVVVQAQMLNAMLTRGFVRTLPSGLYWTIVFLFALLGIGFARKYVNWRGPLLLIVVTLGYLGISVLAFNNGRLHLPWIIPSVLVLATAGGVAWVERGNLQRRWGGYVSPAVLEHILRHGAGMTAERYEASVIFGDIRGFTSFSEKHKPEKVMLLLNRHLERMTQIIYAEHGTIDKFLGDGILVVFGAPLPMEDAAVRAVRASWRMRATSLEPIHDDDGSPYTLASGFGITTGPLVAGHVGGKQRHEFTIIGDTVNLASRLQGVTGQSDVIIDAETYRRVHDHVEVESLGEVTLKGKSQPVACYRVIQWTDTPSQATSTKG